MENMEIKDLLSVASIETAAAVDGVINADKLASYGKAAILTTALPKDITYQTGNTPKHNQFSVEIQTLEPHTYRYRLVRGRNAASNWFTHTTQRTGNAQLHPPDVTLEQNLREWNVDQGEFKKKLSNLYTVKTLKEYLLERLLESSEGGGSRFSQVFSPGVKRQLIAMQALGLLPCLAAADLEPLPAGSFALQFRFRLTSPWHSRDDGPFYLVDNPVRKEWVFKVPEVGPAGWKGVFRHAVGEIEGCLESPRQTRLFGDASAEETDDREDEPEGRQGRLRFFPTFFDRVELYTINPHDRERRAGIQPIHLEVVPPEGEGTFCLLYVARADDDGSRTGERPEAENADRPGPEPGRGATEEKTARMREDMELVGKAIARVFQEQGFGAKTGIDFGRGQLLKSPESTPASKPEAPGKDKGRGRRTLTGFAELQKNFSPQTKGDGEGEPRVFPGANRILVRRTSGEVGEAPVTSLGDIGDLLMKTLG